MFGNILNAIPVVGHVKGICHYVVGDTEGGNKAMKESTRSTVVMGAGAVGSVGGPVGAGAMAVAAGALWDTGESVANDKPTGIMDGIDKIATSVSKGEMPIEGIITTTLTVGADVVGGLGGSGLASSVSQAAGESAVKTVGKSVGESVGKTVGKKASQQAGQEILKSATYTAGEEFGKTVAKNVGKKAAEQAGKEIIKSTGKTVLKETTKKVVEVEVVNIVTYGTSRALAMEVEELSNNGGGGVSSSGRSGGDSRGGSAYVSSSSTRTTSGTSTNTTSGSSTGNSSVNQSTASSGSGAPQRPQQNPTNTHTVTQPTTLSHWQAFQALFGVSSIANVQICGKTLFANLSKGQKKTLKNLINRFGNDANLTRVTETIKNIFATFDPVDVTFENFLSVGEFILNYLDEHKAYQNELLVLKQTSPSIFANRAQALLQIVGEHLSRYDYSIVRVFQLIQRVIQDRNLPINFRNIFAAVYHYYKQRIIGSKELTVEEYYDLLCEFIGRIMNSARCTALRNGGETEIVFEVYLARFGRRFRLVIKLQGGIWVLSSGYFKDVMQPNDQDGDTYVNGDPV